MNGCNLDCIYCSVDEGFSSKRPVDFIIERDYLVNEFRKLLEFKNTTNIHANIAGQGETLMYPEIVELVREIRQIHSVDIISIITNGTMLTELLIDKLVSAGLTRLNISLNAIDKGLADKIANKPYNIEKVKEMIRYASKRLQVILVPVLIPGINDAEIDKIIEFSKSICMEGGNVKLGIQNFLSYRFGRNPVNEISWGEFYERLAGLEKVHNINLKYSEERLFESKELPKPFKKGWSIVVKIICDGRLKNEKLAVSCGRVISIPNCHKEKGDIKVKIVRDKHNIFVGVLK